MAGRSNTVLVAVIGAIVTLATGVLSNWDKLFAKTPIVQAGYTGYKPTGNFETELRYFFEISGTRKNMDTMMKNVLEMQKTQLLSAVSKDAEASAEINKVFDAASQEMLNFDDFVAALLPVYQKYYTIGEIQELNKFYSTDAMRDMVRQLPLIAQDTIPIATALMAKYQKRIEDRLELIEAKSKSKSKSNH